MIWTDVMVEEFITTAMLKGEEIDILNDWINKTSRVEMALKYHCSVATIDRRIKRLKDQYKVAAMYNPLLITF